MIDLMNETDSARWEIGFRNIVSILYGPRHSFEIKDVVEQVRALAKPPAVPEHKPLIWTVSKGGAYTSGEYFVVERIDGKGWNARKGGDTLLLAESAEACKAACEQDATPPAAPVQAMQRYSPDGTGGMEVDSLGAYVKHQDAITQPAAQRQWVGLTLTERNQLCRDIAASAHQVRAIEAKLKEVNT
jgi:hypothetical protein